jgi:geranylgeranyl transferase type-2 subunit alpha
VSVQSSVTRATLDAIPIYAGCMESLVTYKLLLLKNHMPSASQESIDATNQCLTLLVQLEELDPMRQQRYRDMGGFRVDEHPRRSLNRVFVGAQLKGR